MSLLVSNAGTAAISHSLQSAPRKTRAKAEAWGKKRQSYKPLPTRFRHGGFDYRQIAREGDFAIYRQTWNGNEDSAAFEVIRVRRRKGFEINGRAVQAAEVYPAATAWGTDGWTVLSRDAAFAKFEELRSGRLKRNSG